MPYLFSIADLDRRYLLGFQSPEGELVHTGSPILPLFFLVVFIASSIGTLLGKRLARNAMLGTLVVFQLAVGLFVVAYLSDTGGASSDMVCSLLAMFSSLHCC